MIVTKITDKLCKSTSNVCMKSYYVYVMSSQSRVLYTGVTGNLEQRVFQHKTHAFEGFTARYNAASLVYYERFATIHAAIAREKEIKGWRRRKSWSLLN
jgi:putative endonuclease